jgi:uncharacterized protein YfaS (alpha-2-macroglobulin family)
VRDSLVEVFADKLAGGTFVLTYSVRVVTSGKFFAQAARVEEMYTPDICATSQSFTAIIY